MSADIVFVRMTGKYACTDHSYGIKLVVRFTDSASIPQSDNKPCSTNFNTHKKSSKMFAKLAFIASIAILAVATPTPNAQSTCSTGAVQCCSSSGSASDPAISTVLAGYADVDYFSVVKTADSWFT